MKNDSPRVASAPLSHRDDLALNTSEGWPFKPKL
jgi:hypothetical protein